MVKVKLKSAWCNNVFRRAVTSGSKNRQLVFDASAPIELTAEESAEVKGEVGPERPLVVVSDTDSAA